jgi:transposase
MKEAKLSQGKVKRNAEDWVKIARKFGEECVAIQHDPKLNVDKKLEKQRVLGNDMAKEIESDPYLKKEDKKQMIASINNYMDEWETVHDLIQKTRSKAPEKNPKKKK